MVCLIAGPVGEELADVEVVEVARVEVEVLEADVVEVATLEVEALEVELVDIETVEVEALDVETVEVETLEVELTDVDDEIAVEVGRADEDELDVWAVALNSYTLSLFPAPQYSVLLSPQGMLQSPMLAGTAPALNELPHQHSPPYSMPAREYLPLQALMQLAMVRVVTATPLTRARLFVASV